MAFLDPRFDTLDPRFDTNVEDQPLRAFNHISTGATENRLGAGDMAQVVGQVAVPSASKSTSFYASFGKRLLDIVLVVATMPIWLPLIAMFALLVARDGHNPFYIQDRVGRGGRIYKMFKLRSMVPDAHALLENHLAADPQARTEWQATQKLKSDPRITRTGRIIRKMSIDELPQVFNVLMGDMSLVGPRPFMTSQRALYRGESYYDLRPGLTGFWQISNRNKCAFRQRMHYDTAYRRSLSVGTDMWVILRTVVVVLRGTGY